MISSYRVLEILIYLIPGFISEKIIIILSDPHKEQTDLSKIINALIFSVIIYIISFKITSEMPFKVLLDSNKNIKSFEISYFALLITFIFTITLPCLISFVKMTDVHMRLLRSLKLTNNTANKSLWNDIVLRITDRVTINFTDGRRLHGVPLHVSNNPKEKGFYIINPEWIVADENGDLKRLEMEGIEGLFITSNMEIESIELYGSKYSKAVEKIKKQLNED